VGTPEMFVQGKVKEKREEKKGQKRKARDTNVFFFYREKCVPMENCALSRAGVDQPFLCKGQIVK
jgi:hypothetical protein